jgi:hypothetical protein
VINSLFICWSYKLSLRGVARERNSRRQLTGHWLITVTIDIISEMHCRKSIEQASGFWVEQVPTLQATWRVSTSPMGLVLLITASNRNPSCVRSHEKVGSRSIWPRDQQVHRKRLYDCPWHTVSCWVRQEILNVVENTEVSVPSLREPGTWPYLKATHALTL